jgi:RNA polymerase sigma-70 factor (ECF subfamily)
VTVFLLSLIQAQIVQNEEDLRLMMQIVKRDASALSMLYDRYSALVHTMVLKMVKATDEAEDLVQEVFMQVWNKAAMFAATKGSVYTWVVTIARRRAIDRLRSSQSVNKGVSLDDGEVTFELPDAAYASNPFHATITSEYEELMKSGLALLTRDQRTIIELSYYEGYTQQQISKKLKIPLGTVKTRMRQGLMRLRDYLRQRME